MPKAQYSLTSAKPSVKSDRLPVWMENGNTNVTVSLFFLRPLKWVFIKEVIILLQYSGGKPSIEEWFPQMSEKWKAESKVWYSLVGKGSCSQNPAPVRDKRIGICLSKVQWDAIVGASEKLQKTLDSIKGVPVRNLWHPLPWMAGSQELGTRGKNIRRVITKKTEQLRCRKPGCLLIAWGTQPQSTPSPFRFE